MGIYNKIILYCMIAFFTSVCQRMLTVKLRENAQLQGGQLTIEMLLAIASWIHIYVMRLPKNSKVLSHCCGKVLNLSEDIQ